MEQQAESFFKTMEQQQRQSSLLYNCTPSGEAKHCNVKINKAPTQPQAICNVSAAQQNLSDLYYIQRANLEFFRVTGLISDDICTFLNSILTQGYDRESKLLAKVEHYEKRIISVQTVINQ